jgi:hypothetical protein
VNPAAQRNGGIRCAISPCALLSASHQPLFRRTWIGAYRGIALRKLAVVLLLTTPAVGSEYWAYARANKIGPMQLKASEIQNKGRNGDNRENIGISLDRWLATHSHIG